MHPLVAEYYEQWVSPDSQGKLEVDDERVGFAKESPRITKNENGQLFHVMTLYEMYRLGILPTESVFHFNKMLSLSEVRGFPGLYYRRYKDTGIRQSHDNIVAIAAGSLLLGTHHAKLMDDYGHTNGYCYNVQMPRAWDIRTCLTPGDVAIVKLCAGRTPTLWEMSLYAFGRILNRGNAGNVNLAELRAKALKVVRERYKHIYSWVWKISDIADSIFYFRHRVDGSLTWAIEKYFHRDGVAKQNPIIAMAKAKTKDDLK